MKHTRKWERRSDARPAELAQAALELCAERGIQKTKVADVAERAGVTVGTVYRYFRDKDELVAAALALSPRPVATRAPSDRPGSTLPALADALRRWGTWFSAEGARSLRVALSDPTLTADDARGSVDAAERELTELITTGVARGDVRNDLAPSAMARMLLGAIVAAPLLARSDAARAADIDAVTAIATRGLRADGPSWRASGA